MSSTQSATALWTGRVLTAIPALLTAFGSVMKLMKDPTSS